MTIPNGMDLFKAIIRGFLLTILEIIKGILYLLLEILEYIYVLVTRYYGIKINDSIWNNYNKKIEEKDTKLLVFTVDETSIKDGIDEISDSIDECLELTANTTHIDNKELQDIVNNALAVKKNGLNIVYLKEGNEFITDTYSRRDFPMIGKGEDRCIMIMNLKDLFIELNTMIVNEDLITDLGEIKVYDNTCLINFFNDTTFITIDYSWGSIKQEFENNNFKFTRVFNRALVDNMALKSQG